MDIEIESGIIYDTFLFLDSFVNKSTDYTSSEYYRKTQEKFLAQEIPIPKYLSVFFYQPDYTSFLVSSFFDYYFLEFPIKESVYSAMRQPQSFLQRLLTHLFPHDEELGLYSFNKEPLPYAVLQASTLPNNIKLDLAYVLANFEKTIDELITLFNATFEIVSPMHLEIIPSFSQDINSSSIANKLKIITKTDDAENITLALSLIDHNKFQFANDFRTFGMLGINYKDIIDIKYQNRGYNFHTLLNALNSTVKSDIYKALTEKSPLSLVELNSCLHFHERIVRNHIREMIEAGFVVVAHELKRKKYYALNLALIKDILFCHQEDIKKLENLGA